MDCRLLPEITAIRLTTDRQVWLAALPEKFLRRRQSRLESSFDMIAIEPITRRNVLLFKEVRLRALEDSPGAFDSTYAKESQLADSEWMQRVERWNGQTGAGSWRWTRARRAASPDHFSTRMIGRAPTSSPCGRHRHIVSGVSAVCW